MAVISNAKQPHSFLPSRSNAAGVGPVLKLTS
jgi:hypothetical protein